MAPGEVAQVAMKMQQQHNDAGSFRMLLEQKEKEIICLCEDKVLALQQQIIQRDREISDLASKFLRLQDDFKYNLALLDERDVELMQYDASVPDLQASVLEAEERLKEATNALAELQSKEKQKLDTLEERYETELSRFQKQLTCLQKEKHEQAKKLEMLEVDGSELNRVHEELRTRNRHLENEYACRIEKQKLEHQSAVNELLSKIHVAEAEAKHLRRALEEECQRQKLLKSQEMELRECVSEKDRQLQKMASESRHLEKELDNAKLEAQLKTRRCNEKLEDVEDRYENELSQQKVQLDRLTRKLEAAESNLKDKEMESLQQLTSYKEKLHAMEQQIAEKESFWNKKLELVEVEAQKLMALQEQRLEETKLQCDKWKSEHDNIQSQCRMLQKEMYSLQAARLEQMKLPKVPVAEFRGDSEPWLDDLCIPDDVISDRWKEEPGSRRLRAVVQELKHENMKLRSAIETMRIEMESLQNHTLEESLQARREPERKHDDLKQELEALKSLMTKMASHIQEAERSRPATSDNSKGEGEKSMVKESEPHQSSAEIERSQAILRTQLKGAIEEIARLTKERDRLMELSNSLRADLQKALSSAAPASEVDVSPEKDHLVSTGVNTGFFHVEGTAVPQTVRQSLTTPTIIHKGTESQQTRLKSMKQRNEQLKQKPKLRNYNIKDDT